MKTEPELVDQAIEDVLRFRPPAQVLMRKVKEDTDMFRSLMKKGEIVMAWLGYANRDENTFAQGDQLDIHRPNSNKACCCDRFGFPRKQKSKENRIPYFSILIFPNHQINNQPNNRKKQ